MSDGQRLSELSVRRLTERLATHDPTPGGGSAAALAGAMGAALVAMVVELSLGRAELAPQRAELGEIGRGANARRDELIDLAERDAAAYEAVVRARRLPRENSAERTHRSAQIAAATREATRVPLRTADLAADVLELAARVAPVGNPTAVSDVGVAALLSLAALRGALLNVRINLPSLAVDDPLRTEAADRAASLEALATPREQAALAVVAERIGGAPSP